MYGIPHADKAYSEDSEEHYDDIPRVDADRIGIDHKRTFGRS